jgi:hypothetical protein
MKELIFRQYFDDIKDSKAITKTLAHLIKDTFEKKISEIVSLNCDGLMVITKEDREDTKAIFKFDYDDYNSPVELSLHIMVILNSISNGEIKIPEGTIVRIDLVKREVD